MARSSMLVPQVIASPLRKTWILFRAGPKFWNLGCPLYWAVVILTTLKPVAMLVSFTAFIMTSWLTLLLSLVPPALVTESNEHCPPAKEIKFCGSFFDNYWKTQDLASKKYFVLSIICRTSYLHTFPVRVGIFKPNAHCVVQYLLLFKHLVVFLKGLGTLPRVRKEMRKECSTCL